MDEDIRHLELVGWLVARLTDGRNPTIESVVYRNVMGRPEPEAIEGRTPDLTARSHGKLIIGLARMGAEVSSEQSMEDYKFFGNYREPGADKEVAFFLAVPEGRKAEAETALAEAGLDAEQFSVVSIGNFAD